MGIIYVPLSNPIIWRGFTHPLKMVMAKISARAYLSSPLIGACVVLVMLLSNILHTLLCPSWIILGCLELKYLNEDLVS